MTYDQNETLKRLAPLALGQIYLLIVTVFGVADVFQAILFTFVEIEFGTLASLLFFSFTIRMGVRRFFELAVVTLTLSLLFIPFVVLLHAPNRGHADVDVEIPGVGQAMLVGGVYLLMRLGTAAKLATTSDDASRFWFFDVVASTYVNAIVLFLTLWVTGVIYCLFLNDGEGPLVAHRSMAGTIVFFMGGTRLLFTWLFSIYRTPEDSEKSYQEFIDPDTITS